MEVSLRFITVDNGILLAIVDGTALSLQQSASNWGTLEFRVQLVCTLLYPVPIRSQYLALLVPTVCILAVLLDTVPVGISRLLSVPIQVSHVCACNVCIIQVLIN